MPRVLTPGLLDRQRTIASRTFNRWLVPPAWPVSMLGWTYTLFFVFLGSAAAIFGHWLERAGPRQAGFVAALTLSKALVFFK